MLLEHLRTIALSVGLDPDQALQMDFADFARAVAMRRNTREAQRIAFATMARGKARAA